MRLKAQNLMIEEKEEERQKSEIQKAVHVPKKSKKGMALAVLSVIGLAVLCVWLVLDTIDSGAKAANQAHQVALEDSKQEVYDKFYQKGFTSGEKSCHVSNQVLINVDEIKEEQKPELSHFTLLNSEIKYFEEKGGILNFTNGVSEGVKLGLNMEANMQK